MSYLFFQNNSYINNVNIIIFNDFIRMILFIYIKMYLDHRY